MFFVDFRHFFCDDAFFLKHIKLKHLSEDCKALLYKSSPKFREVIEEDIDDPRYHLAANPEEFPKPLSEYKL